MSDIISDIRDVLKKASKGPWVVVHNSWDVSSIYDSDGYVVASCPIQNDVTEETQDDLEDEKRANADLITLLYSQLPHLLDQIAAKDAEIEGLKAALLEATQQRRRDRDEMEEISNPMGRKS